MFPLGKITHFEVSNEFVLLLFSGIFRSKNHPKNLRKRRPDPPEIDTKNALVFDIAFFRSRPRFWSLLSLQLGAKLNPKAETASEGRPLGAVLS